MKLSRKLTLILAAGMLITAFILIPVLSLTTLNGFLKIESDSAVKNLESVQKIISDEIDTLQSKTFDYGAWDDTYTFAAGKNNSFVENNMAEETFFNYKLNYMLIYNNKDNLVYGRRFDLQSQQFTNMDPEILNWINNHSFILQHSELLKGNSGLALLPEGILMIAADSVLTSKREGPSRGNMIMAAYLDTNLVRQISEKIGFELKIIPEKGITLETNLSAKEMNNLNQTGNLIDYYNSSKLYGYQKMIDIDGKNIGYIRLELPRPVYKLGWASIRNLIIILILTGLFLTLLLNIGIQRIILKPVYQINRSVHAITVDSIDLNQVIKSSGNDELSSLGRELNQFLDRLNQVVKNLILVSGKNRKVGEELATSSEEISAMTEEISTSIDIVREKIKSLNREIENSASSMIDTIELVESTSQHIEKQANMIASTGGNIGVMIDSIKNIKNIVEQRTDITSNIITQAQQGRDELLKTAAAIYEISQVVETIHGMLQIIQGITDQLNVLAMNAAIESAHAGEYGLGFAVVASEVKQLADAATVNVKNISISADNVITQIRYTSEVSRKSEASIGGILNGIGEVTEGMKDIMKIMKEFSTESLQIVNQIGDISRVTEQVKKTSSIMKSGASIIHNSIQNVKQISADTVLSFDEIASNSQTIAQAVSNLAQLGVINSESIENLDKQISQFKIKGK